MEPAAGVPEFSLLMRWARYKVPSAKADQGVMGWTILSILFIALQVLAQTGAVVTETMRIEIDNRIHIARKINGRWWSEDNRELSQTNVGWLWNRWGGKASKKGPSRLRGRGPNGSIATRRYA